MEPRRLVHLHASLRHYESHLRPIFDALSPEYRGFSWSTRATDPWNIPHNRRDLPGPDELVMVASWVDYRRVAPRPVVLVEHGAGQAYGGTPETADDPSYSGGRDRDRVVLYIVPNETVAARCRERQPNVPVAVVGCPRLDRFHARMNGGIGASEKECRFGDLPASRQGAASESTRGLAGPPGTACPDAATPLTEGPDRGRLTEPGGRGSSVVSTPPGALCPAVHEPPPGRTDLPARSGVAQSAARRAHNPEVVRSSRTPATKATVAADAPRLSVTVAFTFHHDMPLCPETRSAWPHYDRALPTVIATLRDRDVGVLGHGHPRMWRTLHRRWEQLGVESTPDPDEVLVRADLLVLDNSSLGPEFASLGKPLLWLTAPWYRRDVHHGGRYWQWVEGQVQIDNPDELVAGIEAALQDPLSVRTARERMVAGVYPLRDGRAAQRAAEAILTVLSDRQRSG